MNFKKLPLDENGNLVKNEFEIQSPRNLVEVSVPKSGKTLTKASIPNILVGDCEKGTNYFLMNNVANMLDYEGTDEFVSISKGWIPAGIFQTVDELKKANRMKEYWELVQKLDSCRDEKEKSKIFQDQLAHLRSMPFPIFNVDTITSIQGLNNAAALYEYNLNVSEKAKKTDIKKADEYGGVRYIRNQFRVIKDFIENNAAPFIIWSGHTGEKKKIIKKTDDEISVVDIALEGIMSNTFTSKADAVAIFYRDNKGCWLDFQKKDESDVGSRPFSYQRFR